MALWQNLWLFYHHIKCGGKNCPSLPPASAHDVIFIHFELLRLGKSDWTSKAHADFWNFWVQPCFTLKDFYSKRSFPARCLFRSYTGSPQNPAYPLVVISHIKFTRCRIPVFPFLVTLTFPVVPSDCCCFFHCLLRSSLRRLATQDWLLETSPWTQCELRTGGGEIT